MSPVTEILVKITESFELTFTSHGGVGLVLKLPGIKMEYANEVCIFLTDF